MWRRLAECAARDDPVVVRGSHGFGLKPITKAMHALGLVETVWGDGPTDGLGAMVGAWWCAHEAERRGCTLLDLELMQQIRAYNEVDCEAMTQIVEFLRSRH